VAEGIAEGVAGRYGRAAGHCLVGIVGGHRLASGGVASPAGGYRPPSPPDNPACPVGQPPLS